MKVIVPIKRVIDYNVKPRVKTDGSGVDLTNVKMAMNPFDEIALEEAIRLRESATASEVVVVSVGPQKAQDTLRTGLAMGADRAIHVIAAEAVEPLAVAKILKAVIQEEEASLVILGKQAIDDDCNQTGQMLAALLDWPQATNASRVDASATQVTIASEVDAGSETLQLEIPAIITCDLRLNEPRYASLPNIMKAKAKPLTSVAVETFEVNLTPRLTTVEVSEPTARSAGAKVANVEELAEKIKNLGVVA